MKKLYVHKSIIPNSNRWYVSYDYKHNVVETFTSWKKAMSYVAYVLEHG